jgi:hypothetical protein
MLEIKKSRIEPLLVSELWAIYGGWMKAKARNVLEQTKVHSRIMILIMVSWTHLKRQGFWRTFPFPKSDGSATSARDTGGGRASLISLGTFDLVRFAHR